MFSDIWVSLLTAIIIVPTASANQPENVCNSLGNLARSSAISKLVLIKISQQPAKYVLQHLHLQNMLCTVQLFVTVFCREVKKQRVMAK